MIRTVNDGDADLKNYTCRIDADTATPAKRAADIDKFYSVTHFYSTCYEGVARSGLRGRNKLCLRARLRGGEGLARDWVQSGCLIILLVCAAVAGLAYSV